MEVAKSLGLGKENIFHYVKKFNTGAGKQNYVNLQKLVEVTIIAHLVR